MKHETKYLRIHGTVQGVGYRAWAQEIGKKMNLTGWIRNLRNGVNPEYLTLDNHPV